MRLLDRANHPEGAEKVFQIMEHGLQQNFGRIPTPETRRIAKNLRGIRKQASDELEWRQTTLLLLALGISNNSDGGCGEEEEESRALVADLFLTKLKPLLERSGAHVIGVPGGLIMAYFGFPLGIERSLQNAYRALLEIKRTLPELAGARCVLHCGKALASGQMPDSSGRLTGLAMRLAEHLQPGCALITEAAQKLLRLSDGQPFQRGGGLPAAYLLGEGGREHPQSVTSAPPCLGRDAEIKLLRSQYQVSRNGTLTGVLVTGEAGIGKTRLMQALRAAVGNHWLEARCDPLFAETPFHPLLEMIARDDGNNANRTLREQVRLHLPEVPLVWRGASPDTPAFANAQARAVLLESLVHVVRRTVAQQPMVLLVGAKESVGRCDLCRLRAIIYSPISFYPIPTLTLPLKA